MVEVLVLLVSAGGIGIGLSSSLMVEVVVFLAGVVAGVGLRKGLLSLENITLKSLKWQRKVVLFELCDSIGRPGKLRLKSMVIMVEEQNNLLDRPSKCAQREGENKMEGQVPTSGMI
jgi:hypothetical protein